MESLKQIPETYIRPLTILDIGKPIVRIRSNNINDIKYLGIFMILVDVNYELEVPSVVRVQYVKELANDIKIDSETYGWVVINELTTLEWHAAYNSDPRTDSYTFRRNPLIDFPFYINCGTNTVTLDELTETFTKIKDMKINYALLFTIKFLEGYYNKRISQHEVLMLLSKFASYIDHEQINKEKKLYGISSLLQINEVQEITCANISPYVLDMEEVD